MTRWRRPHLRSGWPQALAAVLLAAIEVGVIVSASWGTSQIPGRLAIFGAIGFTLALVLGSGRLIGFTTLPVLGGAVASTFSSGDPAWVRALVLGVIWYLAAELGWDAIQRRDGVRRTPGYNSLRIREANTVVVLAVAITLAMSILSAAAPARSTLSIALVLVGIAAVVGATATRLRSARAEESPHEAEHEIGA